MMKIKMMMMNLMFHGMNAYNLMSQIMKKFHLNKVDEEFTETVEMKEGYQEFILEES